MSYALLDQSFTAEDLAYWNSWHPASGHPSGKWRVTRGYSPMRELEGKNGRRILFRSIEAAQKRADKLNAASE